MGCCIEFDFGDVVFEVFGCGVFWYCFVGVGCVDGCDV